MVTLVDEKQVSGSFSVLGASILTATSSTSPNYEGPNAKILFRGYTQKTRLNHVHKAENVCVLVLFEHLSERDT